MARIPSAVLRNKGVPVEVAVLDGDKRLANDDESARTTVIHVRFDANALADLEEVYGTLDAFDDHVQKTPTTCIRRALSISWGVSPKIAGLMMLDGKQDDYATAIAVGLALANGVDPQQASDLLEAGMRTATEARKQRGEYAKEIIATANAAIDEESPPESPGTSGGPNGSATETPPIPVSSGV